MSVLTPETPRIRPAHSGDAAELCVLFRLYLAFYASEVPAERVPGFIAERLADGGTVILVAEAAGGLAGFVQSYLLPDSLAAGRMAILNDLFVREECRGAAIGRGLLQAAMDDARGRGCGRMELSTQVANRTAQRLYASLGWKPIDDFTYYAVVP